MPIAPRPKFVINRASLPDSRTTLRWRLASPKARMTNQATKAKDEAAFQLNSDPYFLPACPSRTSVIFSLIGHVFKAVVGALA